MENENVYRQEMIDKYRAAIGEMFRYIPWLEENVGKNMRQNYNGDDKPTHSMPVPVYDSTLLAFVKGMNRTGLMDRNYVYIYSRYGIRGEKDELKVIEQAELKEIDAVLGIMAKYVLGGMTRGVLWSTAVENGVFLHGLKKVRELLDFWNRPLA